LSKYSIPRHLDDPELIGFWTLDEFLVMVVPFIWGIMGGHILVAILLSTLGWFSYRKLKAGRSMSWILHFAYWHLPGPFFGLKVMPPSHLRIMVG
jgi:conjugal transfer pilus assembly protein TraL